MSNDNTNNSPPVDRSRRGSVTSAAFTNLFQRSNSTTQPPPAGPGPITTAAMNDQRRRLSITTVGLTGTSPTNAQPASARRASLSTSTSGSIDENAIEEEEQASASRSIPNSSFGRRMSFSANAMRNMRPGAGSPGSASDQGYNWSEQLRSRAESNVATGGPRASFSLNNGLPGSPPRGSLSASAAREPRHHDRAKSVSDLPAPPAQAAAMKPKQDPRPKPDHFQERILKGDFYMD